VGIISQRVPRRYYTEHLMSTLRSLTSSLVSHTWSDVLDPREVSAPCMPSTCVIGVVVSQTAQLPMMAHHQTNYWCPLAVTLNVVVYYTIEGRAHPRTKAVVLKWVLNDLVDEWMAEQSWESSRASSRGKGPMIPPPHPSPEL